MKFFPASASTLSASHLALFIQERYGFKAATCRLLKTGINHTYLVSCNSVKYIFRVYSFNWRSEKEILEEIRLLNILKENDIPVSYPIVDTEGTFIQLFEAAEGVRLGAMFSYAKGEKLFNYSSKMHYKIGQIMAKMHLITKDLTLERVSYNPNILLIDSMEQLKGFLPLESQEMLFMQSMQKYLIEEFKKVNINEVRKGAVHLDIWFDNLNIDQEDLITLFDFDFCGNGWLCMDIGYYIMQLFIMERDEQEYLVKAEFFLKGYESVIKISSEEKKLIPLVSLAIYSFYLGVQCQRFDNYSNVFLNDFHLKRLINLMIKRWFEYNIK